VSLAVRTDPLTSSLALRDQKARRRLAVGAALVVLGVALVGSAHPDLGGVTLLAGWAALAAAIHAFGRGGAA
jgi:hypothetical protein